MDDETLGQRLWRLRLERDLTRKELGARARISPQAIYLIEKGRSKRFQADSAARVARALRVPQSYLEYGNEGSDSAESRPFTSEPEDLPWTLLYEQLEKSGRFDRANLDAIHEMYRARNRPLVMQRLVEALTQLASAVESLRVKDDIRLADLEDLRDGWDRFGSAFGELLNLVGTPTHPEDWRADERLTEEEDAAEAARLEKEVAEAEALRLSESAAHPDDLQVAESSEPYDDEDEKTRQLRQAGESIDEYRARTAGNPDAETDADRAAYTEPIPPAPDDHGPA